MVKHGMVIRSCEVRSSQHNLSYKGLYNNGSNQEPVKTMNRRVLVNTSLNAFTRSGYPPADERLDADILRAEETLSLDLAEPGPLSLEGGVGCFKSGTRGLAGGARPPWSSAKNTVLAYSPISTTHWTS